MAGIPGQPSANPSDVQSPVPDVGASPFDAAKIQSSPYDSAKVDAPSSALVDPSSTGGQALQAVADYAPATLGIGMGVMGAPGGPLAMGAMGAVGAASGVGWKRFIEQNILGKQQDVSDAAMNEPYDAAATEGIGSLVGAGVASKTEGLAARIGESRAGKAIAEVAAKPLNYVKQTIDEGREKLMEPVLSFIGKNAASKMDAEVAGDTAKTLLKGDIQKRYGPFIEAYSNLDKVMQAQPVADEARYGFTQKIKGWANEKLGGDNARTIYKFANDIDAANNGAQLHSVIGQIEDAMGKAWDTQAYKQYGVLRELRDKAQDFAEGEVTKLAGRIQSGTASEAEMGFLSQLAPPDEANPAKYAKSLASDFLKSKDKISGEYAGFRSFLEDVGEQTKVKVNTKGPMAFLNALDEVPSEKLIERMFDPKNANALREMSQKTPDVFQTVRGAKLNQMIQAASPTGDLDVFAFQKAMNKLPAPSRRMLMSDADLSSMNKALANPRLKALDSLEKIGESWVGKLASNIVEGTRTIAPKAANDVMQSSPGQQVIGRGITRAGQGLAGVFAPGSSEPQQ